MMAVATSRALPPNAVSPQRSVSPTHCFLNSHFEGITATNLNNFSHDLLNWLNW
ncbi:MAG TPA: hypothetical protein IGS40_18055 [Trichormus sp. M33_DOE_039]|nr:hypothetical protein [Trichormus sp. M33_DOE_039]